MLTYNTETEDLYIKTKCHPANTWLSHSMTVLYHIMIPLWLHTSPIWANIVYNLVCPSPPTFLNWYLYWLPSNVEMIIHYHFESKPVYKTKFIPIHIATASAPKIVLFYYLYNYVPDAIWCCYIPCSNEIALYWCNPLYNIIRFSQKYI